MNDLDPTKRHGYLDPEYMTPEEQTQRIVEILAATCVRMATEDQEESNQPAKSNP